MKFNLLLKLAQNMLYVLTLRTILRNDIYFVDFTKFNPLSVMPVTRMSLFLDKRALPDSELTNQLYI